MGLKLFNLPLKHEVESYDAHRKMDQGLFIVEIQFFQYSVQKKKNLKSVFKFTMNKGCRGVNKNLSGVFTGEGMSIFKRFRCFENRKVWLF